MEATTQTLPDDVLALLAPSLPVVHAAMSEGVLTAEHRRMARKAAAVARENGDGGYLAGARNIIATVFPDRIDPYDALRVRPHVEEETACACDACDLAVCDGDCDPCDNSGCEQCNDGECQNGPYSCCAYCPDCEDHHDGHERNNVIEVPCRHRGAHTWCTECEHVCDD